MRTLIVLSIALFGCNSAERDGEALGESDDSSVAVVNNHIEDVVFNSQYDFTAELAGSGQTNEWVVSFPGLNDEPLGPMPMRFCAQSFLSGYGYTDSEGEDQIEFVYGVDCYDVTTIETARYPITNSQSAQYNQNYCAVTVENDGPGSSNYQTDYCPVYYLKFTDSDGTEQSYLFGYTANTLYSGIYNQLDDDGVFVDVKFVQDW
jgi:hypothetical protein